MGASVAYRMGMRERFFARATGLPVWCGGNRFCHLCLLSDSARWETVSMTLAFTFTSFYTGPIETTPGSYHIDNAVLQ